MTRELGAKSRKKRAKKYGQKGKVVTPFTSQAGFKLADFLFADVQLSQKKINHLLELWATMLVPHNDFAPIANNLNLHQQIDAINLGNARWEHADLKYEDPLPRAICHPEWKTTV